MIDIDAEMAIAANLDDDEIIHEEFEANQVWPIKTKFYAYKNKEENYSLGEKLGLKGQALDEFRYTGYEITFDIEISKNGDALATHVNGVQLTKPVKI